MWDSAMTSKTQLEIYDNQLNIQDRRDISEVYSLSLSTKAQLCELVSLTLTAVEGCVAGLISFKMYTRANIPVHTRNESLSRNYALKRKCSVGYRRTDPAVLDPLFSRVRYDASRVFSNV